MRLQKKSPPKQNGTPSLWIRAAFRKPSPCEATGFIAATPYRELPKSSFPDQIVFPFRFTQAAGIETSDPAIFSA